jgi:hypothetical protein
MVSRVLRHQDVITGWKRLCLRPSACHAPAQAKARSALGEAVGNAETALHDLLEYLRKVYVELDLDGSSTSAWYEYVEFHKGST